VSVSQREKEAEVAEKEKAASGSGSGSGGGGRRMTEAERRFEETQRKRVCHLGIIVGNRAHNGFRGRRGQSRMQRSRIRIGYRSSTRSSID
jgi:hypothetical protein